MKAMQTDPLQEIANFLREKVWILGLLFVVSLSMYNFGNGLVTERPTERELLKVLFGGVAAVSGVALVFSAFGNRRS